MRVKVLVTVDIDAIDEGTILPDELQAAAVEAVNDAVEFAQQVGFDHALSEVATIGVVSVEEVVSKRVMTKYLRSVTVIDPDTCKQSEVELRKLDTGEIVGLDCAYVNDPKTGELLNNPYGQGKIVVPEDESLPWESMWL